MSRRKLCEISLEKSCASWGSFLFNCRGSQCPFAEIMPYVTAEASEQARLGSPYREDAVRLSPVKIFGPVTGGNQQIEKINYFDRVELSLYILGQHDLPPVARVVLSEQVQALQEAPYRLEHGELLADLVDLLHEQVVQSKGGSAFRMELQRWHYTQEEIQTLQRIVSGVRARIAELELDRSQACCGPNRT